MSDLLKGYLCTAGLLGLLAALPWFLPPYLIFLTSLMLVYSIVAVGLNLLMGYTGQISLGHAGFLAIGAYTTALLTIHLPGLPCILAILAAGLLTGLAGVLVGLPALRLAGLYLAMATLAFGVVAAELILQMEGLTRGADGLKVPKAALGGFRFDTEQRLYYLILAVGTALVISAVSLVRSRTGRAMVAIRESEIAASTLGINLAHYKTLAFAASAFYTGIAGGLFAFLVAWLSPDAFDIFMSIEFTAMIIIGGLGSILGSVVGAVVMTGLHQMLAGLKDYRTVIYGMVMILFMIFMPEGISGMLFRAGRLVRGSRT